MELADLDLNKIYSYADYYKWKFEERVELIKGKIFKMSPSPSGAHQRISSRIHIAIGGYLKGQVCEVFSAPLPVDTVTSPILPDFSPDLETVFKYL